VVLSGKGARSLFVFELSNRSFALDPAAVARVVALPLLSRPPGTPPLLHGFLNLGGEAVPVLDLRRLLDLAGPDGASEPGPDGRPPAAGAPPDPYAHLIIVKRAPVPLALLVDRAIGLLAVDDEAVSPLQAGQTFNDCAEQSVQLADRTVALLSVDRLLLQEERGRIAELQGIEQHRLRQLEDGAA
jgi:purine-binding chemotaxis protein CheW